MTKRFLILSNFYLPKQGGIEKATQLLAGGLVRRGCAVDVVTNIPLGANDVEADVFPVHRNPSQRRIRELASSADLAIVEDDTLAMVFPVLSTRTPIVVVHQCFKSACPSGTAYRNGKPCLPGLGLKCLSCRVGKPSLWQNARRNFRFHVARRFFNRINRNICLAEYPKKQLGFYNSHIIPNPIDTQLHCPKPESAPTDVRLAMFGRLAPEKGMLFGLEVLSQLAPTVGMDIYGEGDQKQELMERARVLGLEARVRFHGWVKGSALADAYRRATLVLVPSNFEGETFCIVAAEALANGSVVVASTRGALPETVGPGGVTLPFGDKDAWVAAIQHLLTSEAERRQLAERGVEHVQRRFSVEAVAEAFDNLCEALQREKPSRSWWTRWQAALGSRLIDRVSLPS